MKHSELVNAIADATGESQSTVKSVLSSLTATAYEEVGAGNDVNINGLGRVRVVAQDARPGRNPRTGEPITIPAKNRVTFVVGSGLKDAANK